MNSRTWTICLTILAMCVCNLLNCPRLEIITLLTGVSCILGTQKGRMRQ